MKTEKQKRAEYTKLIHEGENIIIAPPGTINGEGGGETDVYTKSEVDSMIGGIDDQLDDVYTKEEVDEAIGEIDLSAKMDKEDPTGEGSLSLNRRESTSIGTNSVAVNTQCQASAANTFACGSQTTASGAYSFASGFQTTASGIRSFAEGNGSKSSGESSHCEGISTESHGVSSHAEGEGTIAYGKCTHVFGEYTDSGSETSRVARGAFLEIAGNGTGKNNRSNARTLDWSGNEWLSGYILPVNGVILPSSTPNSTKYFKLSVDDNGTITATEVTI